MIFNFAWSYTFTLGMQLLEFFFIHMLHPPNYILSENIEAGLPVQVNDFFLNAVK